MAWWYDPAIAACVPGDATPSPPPVVTEAMVAWAMTFWHDNRHKPLTPELVRQLLEGALGAK